MTSYSRSAALRKAREKQQRRDERIAAEKQVKQGAAIRRAWRNRQEPSPRAAARRRKSSRSSNGPRTSNLSARSPNAKNGSARTSHRSSSSSRGCRTPWTSRSHCHSVTLEDGPSVRRPFWWSQAWPTTNRKPPGCASRARARTWWPVCASSTGGAVAWDTGTSGCHLSARRGNDYQH